jgi:hypothetical protein
VADYVWRVESSSGTGYELVSDTVVQVEAILQRSER